MEKGDGHKTGGGLRSLAWATGLLAAAVLMAGMARFFLNNEVYIIAERVSGVIGEWIYAIAGDKSLWFFDHEGAAWIGETFEEFLFSLPIIVAAIVIYFRFNRHYGRAVSSETRCRRCGFILRGISSPECPECGERI